MIVAMLSGKSCIVLHTAHLRNMWLVWNSHPLSTDLSSPSDDGRESLRRGEMAEVVLELGIKAELGHRPRHRALHRPDADPQQAGDLRLGQILVVAQDDGDPLAFRQPVQRAGEGVVYFGT